jgi:hypothetical protein
MNSILIWVEWNINQSDLGMTRRRTVTWDAQCHMLVSLGINHRLLGITARVSCFVWYVLTWLFKTKIHVYDDGEAKLFLPLYVLMWAYFVKNNFVFCCSDQSKHCWAYDLSVIQRMNCTDSCDISDEFISICWLLSSRSILDCCCCYLTELTRMNHR